MFENGRSFNEAEIKKAETLLLMLAHKSALFWTNAFMSSSFLYQGNVWYNNSSFYKAGSWKDSPNENRDPITAEQIVKFVNAYMEEAKKSIEKWLQNDMEVAKILGLKSRLHGVDWLGKDCDEYLFGAWDNDPWGAVAVAKKAAALVGPMSVNSPYRKTAIVLCRGVIYRRHYGTRNKMEVIDIQN